LGVLCDLSRVYERDFGGAQRWRRYRWNELQQLKAQYQKEVRTRFLEAARYDTKRRA
jgi:hypothetical protein